MTQVIAGISDHDAVFVEDNIKAAITIKTQDGSLV